MLAADIFIDASSRDTIQTLTDGRSRFPKPFINFISGFQVTLQPAKHWIFKQSWEPSTLADSSISVGSTFSPHLGHTALNKGLKLVLVYEKTSIRLYVIISTWVARFIRRRAVITMYCAEFGNKQSAYVVKTIRSSPCYGLDLWVSVTITCVISRQVFFEKCVQMFK